MVEVELKNLAKSFGDVVAVKDINLSVKDKSFMVLLGPSGCGKTTILRCMAGLETPEKGEILIGGKVVNELSPKDRNIAMVFQDYALYPHMTVYNNIAFPLKNKKLPKDEIDKKVKKTAQLLHIEKLLGRHPEKLSGGEKQRVALGRSIVREATVFLMDEPLSNIDAKLRLYMRSELKKLQRDLGITTIYVTHDQIEALAMADKIAILKDGVLQQYAVPSEIYDRPANEFVAGFIGAAPMNLIECSLVENNNSIYLEFGNYTYKLDGDIAKVLVEKAWGSELTLGIRPEDILLDFKRVKDFYEGEVYVIESLGRDWLVNVKLGEKILKIITNQPLTSSNPRDKLWIAFNKEKIHIFDKRKGLLV